MSLSLNRAAPALLEALELALPILERFAEKASGTATEAVEKARAAIALARTTGDESEFSDENYPDQSPEEAAIHEREQAAAARLVALLEANPDKTDAQVLALFKAERAAQA